MESVGACCCDAEESGSWEFHALLTFGEGTKYYASPVSASELVNMEPMPWTELKNLTFPFGGGTGYVFGSPYAVQNVGMADLAYLYWFREGYLRLTHRWRLGSACVLTLKQTRYGKTKNEFTQEQLNSMSFQGFNHSLGTEIVPTSHLYGGRILQGAVNKQDAENGKISQFTHDLPSSGVNGFSGNPGAAVDIPPRGVLVAPGVVMSDYGTPPISEEQRNADGGGYSYVKDEQDHWAAVEFEGMYPRGWSGPRDIYRAGYRTFRQEVGRPGATLEITGTVFEPPDE